MTQPTTATPRAWQAFTRAPRSDLTGPLPLGAVQDTMQDPAHWWPGFHEPIYAEMYALHRARLAAGLRLTWQLAQPDDQDPDEEPAGLLQLVRTIDGEAVTA